MKSLKIFYVLFFFFSGINAVKADQWEDPNWREMIDSSDVIALVKYITNGSFRAKAQVLTVYKGNLNANDQIWISGFSNRYGPIDSMSIGETYLVFVTRARPTPKSISNLEEQLKEKSEMAGYIEALKAGTAYYVWTPTAGDLRVMENQVQYDLMQTTFYSKQPFHALPEFEAFLRAAIRKEPSEQLSIKLLSLVQTNPGSKQTDQRLMMLYLTGYRQYHSIFQKVSLQKNISTRFALARLLGNIKTDRSRQLLIQLLNDKNGAVQGEAVRQLSNEPADYIGPVLVKRLQSSSKGVYGPTNIMDPVINTISGGQIEIIETLGKLKYKPAVPFLLPLLSTEDDYTFNLLVETLKSLGSTDYVPYLNRHLERRTESLIFNICKLVTEDSLNQCVPSLMKYVATTDKTDHMSKEFTVSSYLGLAHFETDTVKRFLVKDFLHLLKNDQPRKFIDNRKKWVKEYIETFTKLGIDTLKPYMYDFLYNYYGINKQFKSNPILFEIKKSAEDSLIHLAKEVLPRDSLVSLQALVFVSSNSSRPFVSDYVLKYTTKGGVSFDHMNEILKKKGIAEKHLIGSTGSYSQIFGSVEMTPFDESFMRNFLTYISTYPDSGDLQFLKNLSKYDYPERDYDKKKLNEFIETAAKNLK